jgi:cell wall-associated NlpC family hydrolase
MLHRLFLNILIVLALTVTPNSGNATSAKSRAKKYNKMNPLAEASRAPTPSREAALPSPLIKISPLQDGKFLLEPLTAPPKTLTPSSSWPHKNDHRGISALSEALAHRPVRYARGESLETGGATDCSGFTQFIFQHGFSVYLPRSSIEQANVGQTVTRKMDFTKLLPGDLLLFSDQDRPIGHAGIYLGKGLMIHASSKRRKVVITDVRQGYYYDNFVVAKRFLKEPGPKVQVIRRPRLVESNPAPPTLPSQAFSISRLMPIVAAKMGGLLKVCRPWEGNGIKPPAPQV